MRSALVIAAVAGLAIAHPFAEKRQNIQFDQFDAADVPVVQSAPIDGTPGVEANDVDAASPKVKRADCDAQPSGSGPLTSPDTDVDFLANSLYNQMASAAGVPDGYSLAFSGATASTKAASYKTFYNLDSYDPIACQQKCDQSTNCFAFNLYIERDPTLSPASACSNPASTVNFKCALYGSHIDGATATNNGQWRNKFHVVISGSNGYNKLAAPVSQPGFSAPVELSGAINAPDNSYINYEYFPGPYDPSQCATGCLQNSAYNKAHPRPDGTYDTCYFFNSYVLSKNGAPQGTYCSRYTKAWSKQYAVNYGQYRGSDRYTVSQSYGWTLSSS